MTEQLLLFITLLSSCLLGISGQDDTSQNTYGRVRCQECTIVKSMNNDVVSVFDEVTHTTVARCQEYECDAGQEWCLVTYYKNTAIGDNDQNKHEVHECGSKTQKESDYRCIELKKEDAHSRIQYCKTQRSGSTDSMFAVSLSVVVSLLFVIMY